MKHNTNKHFRNKFFLKKIYSILFIILSIVSSNHLFSQCVNTFPNTQDFEAAAVWTSGGSNNDWTWGAPTKSVITGAGGGSKCWITGGLSGTSYKNSEQSYIVSPCYDFTTLTYPHVKFKIFWEMEKKYDGGNFQYSINGGTTWINVGAFGDVVDCMTANWFNYAAIVYLNNPAWISTNNGWSGNIQPNYTSGGTTCQGGSGSGGWVVAQHCLNGLAGQPSVKFRFTFAAGTTCNSYDGMAIDDFTIENGIANAPDFTYACSGTNKATFTSINPACPTPTTFSWNFGDTSSGAANTSTSANPTHTFTSAGNYTVTLTTSGGPCNPPGTLTKTVSIVSASISSQTNVNCNGGNNGSITVSTINGTANFTYTWSPSVGTTNTVSALTAGTYTTIVTDANGCSASASTLITQPPLLTASTITTKVSCFGGNNGSATVTANGGTSGYTYSWTPSGGTNTTASNLTAGTYTVITTDSKGCTASASATVTQPASALSATTTATPVSCFGGNNGSATVSASGGTSGYTYSWTPSGGTNITASNLTAGTYTVNVTDAKGCTTSAIATVTQPASALSATTTTSPVLCFGGNNGSATVTANSGTAGYTYNWTASGGTNITASNLIAGTYTVNVTDAKGCTASASVNVTQPISPLSVTTSATAVNCFGGNNGSATVTTTGGTAGYTYNWTPSGGTTTTASNLTAGTYTVNVTDTKGCTTSATATVTQPASALSATTTTTPVLCFGGNNGSATVTANGGTAGYTYSWTPSGGTTTTASNLTAGTYTVNVTDAKGCTTSATANVAQPNFSLSVVASNDVEICNGNSTTLVATAIGGSGNYNYVWSPNNNSGNSITVSPNTAMSYTVTLTDGCASATDEVNVSIAPNPTIHFGADVLNGCEPVCTNFTDTLTISQGSITNFQWNFGDGQTAATHNPNHCYTSDGVYTVSLIATSDKGCKDTLTRNNYIDVYAMPNAAFTNDPLQGSLDNPTIDFINQSTNATIYQWNFGDSFSSSEPNPSHTYLEEGTFSTLLIATNSDGCMDSVRHEIRIDGLFTFYAPNAFTPNRNGNNDIFIPIGTGWDFSSYDLWVYDRWGNMCFHTNDAMLGWDGKANNGSSVSQEDVYVWKVFLKDIYGKNHHYIGNVVIIK